ncbi:hypothetical protein V2J09_016409 [Rumex salicifolius]
MFTASIRSGVGSPIRWPSSSPFAASSLFGSPSSHVRYSSPPSVLCQTFEYHLANMRPPLDNPNQDYETEIVETKIAMKRRKRNRCAPCWQHYDIVLESGLKVVGHSTSKLRERIKYIDGSKLREGIKYIDGSKLRDGIKYIDGSEARKLKFLDGVKSIR